MVGFSNNWLHSPGISDTLYTIESFVPCCSIGSLWMAYSLARCWNKLDIGSANYKICSAIYPLISPHCLCLSRFSILTQSLTYRFFVMMLDPFMTSLGKRTEIVNFFTFIFLPPFFGNNGEKISFNLFHFFLLMFSINFLYYTSGESFSQIQLSYSLLFAGSFSRSKILSYRK